MNDVSHETPGIGDNFPPSDEDIKFTKLDTRSVEIIATVNKWAKERQVIETPEQSVMCHDLTTMIKEHARDVEAARNTFKKPHSDAAKAVDTRFRVLHYKDKKTGSLDVCLNLLKPLTTAWLKKLEADQLEETRKAEEKAETARLAEVEANRKAEASKAGWGDGKAVEDAVTATQATKTTQQAVKTATRISKAPVNVSGTAGRATGLRTTKSAVIVNQGELYQHFCNNPRVIEVLQSLANIQARSAGAESVPGCTIKTDRT